MMPRTSGTCRGLKRNLHNSAFGGRPTNPSSCHTIFVELPPCTSVSVSPSPSRGTAGRSTRRRPRRSASSSPLRTSPAPWPGPERTPTCSSLRNHPLFIQPLLLPPVLLDALTTSVHVPVYFVKHVLQPPLLLTLAPVVPTSSLRVYHRGRE